MSNTVMKRFCVFNTDKSMQAPYMGLAWVSEMGGTIVTNCKQTYMNTFDLNTEKQFKDFEERCGGWNIKLDTLRGCVGRISGKRLLLLYLDEEELAEVEDDLERGKTNGELEEILLVVWVSAWAINWAKRYSVQVIGEAPSDWDLGIDDNEAADLPQDIVKILESLALSAKGYGNSLQWWEEAKLKSDLMLNWDSWRDVDIEDIRTQCGKLGMSLVDIKTIVDLIQKRKNGKRLVPSASYKNFMFTH